MELVRKILISKIFHMALCVLRHKAAKQRKGLVILDVRRMSFGNWRHDAAAISFSDRCHDAV